MVLFLFIIMLLDLKAEARRKVNVAAYVGGIAVAIAFVAELAFVLERYLPGQRAFPALPAGTHDDVRNLGMTLFTTENLPLQIVGVLLLVATVGVVILSRRGLK
jgi:NADH-quinone oxidoreductase subunit J